MTRPKGFSPKVIAALKRRSGGVCEGCHVATATNAHHRLYRSRGGPDTLGNALHLCGSGNHTGCHGIAHTGQGEANGWSVASGYSPLLVPVLVMPGPFQRWVRISDEEAAPVEVRTADAVEYMTLIGAGRKAYQKPTRGVVA